MEECFTQTTHFLFFFLFFFYFFSSSLGCCWPHCCVSSASSYVVDAGIGWFWLFRFVLQPNKYIRLWLWRTKAMAIHKQKMFWEFVGISKFFCFFSDFYIAFFEQQKKKNDSTNHIFLLWFVVGQIYQSRWLLVCAVTHFMWLTSTLFLHRPKIFVGHLYIAAGSEHKDDDEKMIYI